MMYQNPFTPVFGNEPPIIGGRDRFIHAALSGLDNAPGDPNRITIFTGPRGSGKTVLLSVISARAEERGWITVHVPTAENMLIEILEQIERKAAEHLPRPRKSHLTSIQVSGVGISRTVTPEGAKTWRTTMDSYLDILAERQIGLLITVDEIRPRVVELVSLVSTFQIFVMEKRNVALLMAGLPGNVVQLLSNDSISFLRRAFRRELEPVSMPDTRTTLKRTIELAGRDCAPDALEYAAQFTEGYPFLIQLIGYHMFNQSGSVTIKMEDSVAGVRDATQDMKTMILDATLSGLTKTDVAFLRAMLPDENHSRISNIAKRMRVSASQASHYKRRLVHQGVISECGRGLVEFSMPMLKDLLLNS